MKFKHGQRVTCKIIQCDVTKIKDAKISINSDGSKYVCQNQKDGNNSAKDKLGYKYSFDIENVTDLKPLIKDWDNLEIGDEIGTDNGIKTVLGVCGLVIHLSCIDSPDSYDNGYTVPAMKRNNWTIVQSKKEEEKVEVTMDEIAEMKGIDVKNLKIKK